MTDVPFVVSARFRKVVQTAPYESEEAEVSTQFAIPENANAQPMIEDAMRNVKHQVLIALGKAFGTLTATSTVVLKAVDASEKRGPGRPKKEPEAEKAADTPKVETKDDDFDFGDKAAPAKEIPDSDLQSACSSAAAIITPAKVKSLFQTKYGAQRVSLVKQSERQAFLDDLASLVTAEKK